MIEVWTLVSQLAQIAASIVFVGFLPGFVLIQLLFPRTDFDQIEKFFLSVLSSLCMTCLLAYGLTWTDAGLTSEGLVLLSTVLTGICLLASALKVGFRKGENRWLSVHLNRENQNFAHGSLFKVGGLVLLGFTVVVFVSDLHSQAMPLTEFYVAPEILEAERVHYWPVSGGVVVPVEVVNREERTVNYRLVAWAGGQEVGSAYQNTLSHAQTWSVDMFIPLLHTDDINVVDLLLMEEKEETFLLFFKVEEKTLMAELRIWLNHSIRGEKDNGN